MRVLVASLFTGVAGLHEWNATSTSGCVYPGTCKQPAAKYTKVLNLQPRQQWNIDGGFCGALSIQQAALGVGAWISQDLVRKANTHGEGHGSSSKGYEVLPSNVQETVTNLKLASEEWDYNQPKPQAKAFKAFIKRNLVKGHPIVWFPICKGDSHDPYRDDIPNGGAYDHVEPMWGIGSNHPLNDATVYDDDWILHGSDQDLEPYYRFMNTLEDDLSMQGNCKNAGSGFGKNEMYPCFYEKVTYGAAVQGLKKTGNLPVVLNVDTQNEPNIRSWSQAKDLHGTVTVSGLTAGHNYILYRYGSTASLPTGSSVQGYENKIPFTAEGETWTHKDTNTFKSSSATYYVAVPADDVVV
jgi:hypothetical protein